MFDLFDKVVEEVDWREPEDLLLVFKHIGEKLTRKDRMNFVVRNCSERMIRILKEVSDEVKKAESDWGTENISKRP
jgi:hypothetical protein